MALDPAESLQQYVDANPDAAAFCVAYSGGMDSHVLLHLAARLLAPSAGRSLRAVHVNHGLQADSDRWAKHCDRVCKRLDVPLTIRRVQVRPSGNGPEADARLARYAAFSSVLVPGEHLLVAQHADDQAETFLLQALRGSGPDGLGSIPKKRVFGEAIMARPLLGCTRRSLQSIAENASLEWLDDPSNASLEFDRNYLRHEIMPRILDRWPAAVQTLGRSALRSAAASQTLLTLAQEDLETVRVRGTSELSIPELANLPRERGYNVLRLWVRHGDMRMPRLQDLAEVHRTLVRAREDSIGVVNVRDYEFRRWRDRLYLLPPQSPATAYRHEWPAGQESVTIPELALTLSREGCRERGINVSDGQALHVQSRRGGELIKLGQPAFHKAVKKLLQESGVPPWQRERVPLIYCGEHLISVWEVAVSADWRLNGSGPRSAAQSRTDRDGPGPSQSRREGAAEGALAGD